MAIAFNNLDAAGFIIFILLVDGKQSCCRLPAAALQLKEGFAVRSKGSFKGYA
jgi:hypothetical protein